MVLWVFLECTSVNFVQPKNSFYVALNQSQLFFVCKELIIVNVQVPVIEGAADQLLDGGGAGVRRQKRQIMLVEMVEMVASGGGRCPVNVSHVHHLSAMFLLSLTLLLLELSDVHHVVQPHSLLHLVGLWRHRLTSFARHLPSLLLPFLLLPAPKFSNCQSRKFTLTSTHPFTDGFPSSSASMGFLEG